MSVEGALAQPPKAADKPDNVVELSLVPKVGIFDKAFDPAVAAPMEVQEVSEDEFNAVLAAQRAAEDKASLQKPAFDMTPPKIDKKIPAPELTLEPELIPLANPDGGVRRPAKKQALTDEAWEQFKASAGQPVKKGAAEDFVDSTRDLSQAEVQEIFDAPQKQDLSPEQKIQAERILRQQEDLGLRLSAEIGELTKAANVEQDPAQKNVLMGQIKQKEGRLDQIHRFLAKARSPML